MLKCRTYSLFSPFWLESFTGRRFGQDEINQTANKKTEKSEVNKQGFSYEERWLSILIRHWYLKIEK